VKYEKYDYNYSSLKSKNENKREMCDKDKGWEEKKLKCDDTRKKKYSSLNLMEGFSIPATHL
jgi:hypothetical protein